MKTHAGNLKRGEFVRHLNEIWQVAKAEFYNPGKGSAIMRTRLKNMLSPKQVDITFKSGESVETVDVESREMKYLYKDQEYMYFMEERTYNQYQVLISVIGDVAKFYKEGDSYFVYLYEDQPLSVRPPVSVKLKVTQTEDAAKGDTVSGAKKAAVVETGITVMVPLFVRTGDLITVNPETGEYGERVKE